MSERDVLEVLKEYRQRAEKFKRDMAKLGVKVKITASLGKWTSTVEKCSES